MLFVANTITRRELFKEMSQDVLKNMFSAYSEYNDAMTPHDQKLKKQLGVNGKKHLFASVNRINNKYKNRKEG